MTNQLGRTLRHCAIPALAMMLTLTHSRAAKASATDIVKAIYNPMTFINSFDDAFQLYQGLESLFGLNGPSTATLINQAVTQLETYMSTQRDLQWQSAATASVHDLQSLAWNQPSDPTNPSLYPMIFTEMGGVIDEMYTTLASANDPRSSYESAPVLNGLAPSWIGLLMMKAQIFPQYPSVWGDYQLRLQEIMDFDFRVVGAQEFMCYPGWNPWYGNYTTANAYNGYFTDKRDMYASQFWHNLTNHYFYGDAVSGGDNTGYCSVGYYNLATGAYLDDTSSCDPDSGNPYDPFKPALLQSLRDNYQTTSFDTDPVVQIVRDGMNQLMWVGGGDDPYDSTSTDLPDYYGVFIDPWVWETANCNAYLQSAYVMVP
jgi:hypothetical protein